MKTAVIFSPSTLGFFLDMSCGTQNLWRVGGVAEWERDVSTASSERSQIAIENVLPTDSWKAKTPVDLHGVEKKKKTILVASGGLYSMHSNNHGYTPVNSHGPRYGLEDQLPLNFFVIFKVETIK